MVPERLEEIVEKALAKNRDERYQTSKDLLIDLKRLRQSMELKAGLDRCVAKVRRGHQILTGSLIGVCEVDWAGQRGLEGGQRPV